MARTVVIKSDQTGPSGEVRQTKRRVVLSTNERAGVRRILSNPKAPTSGLKNLLSAYQKFSVRNPNW